MMTDLSIHFEQRILFRVYLRVQVEVDATMPDIPGGSLARGLQSWIFFKLAAHENATACKRLGI